MGNNQECCNNKHDCCEESRCEEKSSTGCEMTDMMMGIADHAWEELMKEKIKKEFEKQIGERMNKVASASASASIAHHTHMMEGKMKIEEHKTKLRQAFMG